MNEFTNPDRYDVKCRCDYDFYELLGWTIIQERTLRDALVDEIWDQYQAEWLTSEDRSRNPNDWFEFRDWAFENYETNIEVDGPDVIVSISRRIRR